MTLGYGPVRPRDEWMRGNHWAVAHRCDRCGLVTYRLYEPGESGEGNLQCLEAPEGWRRKAWMLLCPDCAGSFDRWMKEGR